FQNSGENLTLVYLDETWLYQNGSSIRLWVHESDLKNETLRENGHEVLRLPPYHCQYNPIEMAWGFCKSYYNKHIKSQPLSKDRGNLIQNQTMIITQIFIAK
ncbi:DDE 3 domain containing protein, partial [Asbolus verrucosus]